MNSTKNIAGKISAFFGPKKCSRCLKSVRWYHCIEWIPENQKLACYKKPRKVEDAYYCDECARANFKICEICDKVSTRLRKIEGKKICDSCFDDKTDTCEECGVRKFNNSLRYIHDTIACCDCYDNLNRRFRCINIGQKKEYSKTFVKNPKISYCGVEIECLNDENDKNCFIRKELKQFRFSQGTDYSLSGGGVEFRSVPMNGDLLFDSIEAFGKALNKKSYKVDSSCGLHVHLEVEQQLALLKKIYLFYLRFEDLFFDMLPKSRRSKGYCKRFRSYYNDSTDEIMGVKTLDAFKEMLYETSCHQRYTRRHGYDKRYCWANLHSIFYRGTLEIRSHSGTINPSKIINWIMIHQEVLEFLKEKSIIEIGTMKVTKKAFLDIFPRPLQNYIKRRWKTFIHLGEDAINARSPSYVLPASICREQEQNLNTDVGR